MNTLKIKATIFCDTCGCKMKRIKSIKVSSETKEAAIKEAKEKTMKWKESLAGQSCKTCRTIISELEG